LSVVARILARGRAFDQLQSGGEKGIKSAIYKRVYERHPAPHTNFAETELPEGCPLQSKTALVLLSALLVSACSGQQDRPALPEGFVRLSELDPSIQHDIRYFGNNNFMGRPVTGYQAAECILSIDAAEALVEVQRTIQQLGLSLKVYDCYRPQQAVNDFMQWAADSADQRMRESYYPTVPKAELFAQGYIAERSGHSRGSTVDLTLVPAGSAVPVADPHARQYDCRAEEIGRFPDNSLDMGTGYDCFDVRSHTDNLVVGADALRNRFLLRDLMEAAGFTNYDQEWWHYTLNNEPFPDQYFDFPVN